MPDLGFVDTIEHSLPYCPTSSSGRGKLLGGSFFQDSSLKKLIYRSSTNSFLKKRRSAPLTAFNGTSIAQLWYLVAQAPSANYCPKLADEIRSF